MLFRGFNWWLNKSITHPFSFSAINGTFCFGLGDIIQQKLDISSFFSGKQSKNNKVYNPYQTFKMCTYALCMTPVMHFFYTHVLLRLVPLSVPAKKLEIVKKVCYDYIILSPSMSAFFVCWNGLLDGMNPTEILEKLKRDFFIIIIADGAFWPAFNYFNFMYVLPRMQTTVVAIGTLFSACIMSAIESRNVTDIKEIDQILDEIPLKIQDPKEKRE